MKGNRLHGDNGSWSLGIAADNNMTGATECDGYQTNAKLSDVTYEMSSKKHVTSNLMKTNGTPCLASVDLTG